VVRPNLETARPGADIIRPTTATEAHRVSRLELWAIRNGISISS
jgi:hypothetical protein